MTFGIFPALGCDAAVLLPRTFTGGRMRAEVSMINLNAGQEATVRTLYGTADWFKI